MSKLINKDFSYSVEYDCDISYSCFESGCDSICRCGCISNVEINSININKITNDIYSLYFDNSLSSKRDNKISEILYGITKEIDIYTIDRIIRHFGAHYNDNWVVEITGGYYGDEIGDIVLSSSVADSIESSLDIAFSIDNLSSRIEYLILLEYGQLLPELLGCNYDVVTISKDDIIFGSEGHYGKVKSKNIDHYNDNNYNGIRGIVIKKNKDNIVKYRLIDGYHRCIAMNNSGVKVLMAYK